MNRKPYIPNTSLEPVRCFIIPFPTNFEGPKRVLNILLYRDVRHRAFRFRSAIANVEGLTLTSSLENERGAKTGVSCEAIAVISYIRPKTKI